MAKNLVSKVGVRVENWEEWEENESLASKRAKIEKATAVRDASWAFKNAVDDAAIKSIFGEDSHLLDLPYQERFDAIKRAQLSHWRDVRTDKLTRA